MKIARIMLCAVFALAVFGTMPALAAKEAETSKPDAVKAGEDASLKSETTAETARTEPAETAEKTLPLAPETVLVKVNDQDITQADLDKELGQIRKMMEGRGIPPKQFEAMIKGVKPQIMEGIIVRRLIAGECEREKIAVTPEETTGEINLFQTSLPKKTTLDDFLKKNNISRDAFEQDVNEQIKIEKLLKVSAPTDEEIKTYYDENKTSLFETPETINARHILIAIDATDDDSAKKSKKKKAEDLLKKLNKGGDFAKLAEENSDCPSKARGGSLGDFPRGNMVPAFEEAAFSLKTNEISGVVETEFGYHIIQTIAHNPAQTKPFEDVKGQIAFRLKGKKIQEKMGALVAQLKDAAKIDYTKEGESLKPARLPAGMPFMPAGGKEEAGTAEPGKEKSGEPSADKK